MAVDVAILGSPNDSNWNTEVQSKLLGTGFFTTVDVYNIAQVTPTLNQLMQYQSVLVYSNGAGYQNSNQLGNNLADYVDAGGGVVVAVFANASIPFGGRFNTDNYWVIVPASQDQGTRLTLGTVYDANHPLMAGVSTFDGGSSSYHSTGNLHGNATRVADWSNGRPLIAERVIGGTRRVDLNFFPPSSDSRGDFWESRTDGARIMGNALLYVPEPGTALLALAGLAALAIRRRQV